MSSSVIRASGDDVRYYVGQDEQRPRLMQPVTSPNSSSTSSMPSSFKSVKEELRPLSPSSSMDARPNSQCSDHSATGSGSGGEGNKVSHHTRVPPTVNGGTPFRWPGIEAIMEAYQQHLQGTTFI